MMPPCHAAGMHATEQAQPPLPWLRSLGMRGRLGGPLIDLVPSFPQCSCKGETAPVFRVLTARLSLPTLLPTPIDSGTPTGCYTI